MILIPIVTASTGLIDVGDYSYKPIYENNSKQVPIYTLEKTLVKPVYYDKNDSWSKEYYTEEMVLTGYKTEYYEGKKIGVEIDGKKFYGDNNIQDDLLVEWSVPIGDRNMEEFGRCRKYEIQKGVCWETYVLSAVAK